MDECHRCVNYECRDPREPGTPGDLCCYSGEGVQQCARWQADRAVAAEKRLAEALAARLAAAWARVCTEYPNGEGLMDAWDNVIEAIHYILKEQGYTTKGALKKRRVAALEAPR